MRYVLNSGNNLQGFAQPCGSKLKKGTKKYERCNPEAKCLALEGRRGGGANSANAPKIDRTVKSDEMSTSQSVQHQMTIFATKIPKCTYKPSTNEPSSSFRRFFSVAKLEGQWIIIHWETEAISRLHRGRERERERVKGTNFESEVWHQRPFGGNKERGRH